jgi:hypothetical protein
VPRLWLVPDGPAGSQRGAGRILTFDQVRAVFSAYRARYLGANPPTFNVTQPSIGPMRVVIGVVDGEAPNADFPKAGYYLMEDLSPTKAQELLQTLAP